MIPTRTLDQNDTPGVKQVRFRGHHRRPQPAGPRLIGALRSRTLPAADRRAVAPASHLLRRRLIINLDAALAERSVQVGATSMRMSDHGEIEEFAENARRRSARFRSLARIGVLATTLLVAVSCGGLFYFGIRNTYRESVSPAAANATLHQNFALPSAATDVNLRTNVRSSTVDFAVSEADFVEWCRARGWRTIPVTRDAPTLFNFAFSGVQKPRLTTDGLRCAQLERCGFRGVYDRDLSRASVEFLCR